MEKLIKSQNGQWTLVKTYEPEEGMPHTDVHFHDGSKKSFPFRHQAVTHLMVDGYLPQGEPKDNVQHFNNVKDPSKAAKLIHHPGRFVDSEKPSRRSTDIKE
mgnify:CR=1 FL=1